MKVYVGFRYLADNCSAPVVVFREEQDAKDWEKTRWNSGYVELEVENGSR